MSIVLGWIAVGAAAGSLQALGLWRSAHRRGESALADSWRIPIVAGVLAAAAVANGLPAGAGGWAMGLAGTSVLLCARSAR